MNVVRFTETSSKFKKTMHYLLGSFDLNNQEQTEEIQSQNKNQK